MDDRYPSTDEHQAVALDLPAKQGLNRSLPLVKWLLAIPHYILLVFRSVAAVVAVIIAWFAILFTGRYSSIVELAPGELGASPFGGTTTRSEQPTAFTMTC